MTKIQGTDEGTPTRDNRTYTIQRRKKVLVNTDPQRRCYNGAHFSYEFHWSGWEALNIGVSAETLESKLTFWRDLNDYAVSQRGSSARCEFRAVPEGEGG